MSLSVKEILNIGERRMNEAGVSDASIDSKSLYCYMMNLSESKLILEYQKVIQDNICDEYFRLLDIRCSGVPIQYITGKQEFMGIGFSVDENVLIPRQDTETLVEDAIEIIKGHTLRGKPLEIGKIKHWEVLDLCCGSGAIGISMAMLCENIKVTCSDVSKGALEVARKNLKDINPKNKVSIVEGNFLDPFRKKMKNTKFNMIISNPPYIRSSVISTLQKEVRDHEPVQALDGGVDGLDCYRQIIGDAAACLKKRGVIMLEIGHDQREDVCGLLKDTGCFTDIDCLRDLAGRDRVVIGILTN